MSLAYQPEIVRFPEPSSMYVIGLYLTSLIANTYSNIVDLENNNYSIPVIFKEYDTLIEISYMEEPYNIKIKNEINNNEPCLHIRIYQDKQNIVSKLIFVRTKNVMCNIPETKVGTWLVLRQELLLDINNNFNQG